MNITIDPNCNETIKENAERWLVESAIWSAAQYDKVDLQAQTTWSIQPYEFNVVTIQPQHRPIRIEMSEVDNIGWTPEIQKREWFTSQLYHVGFEVGLKASAIGLMRSAKHTLANDINDEQYREGWDSKVCPMEEKLLFIQEQYPQLIELWTDRAGWLSDHVANLSPEHWRFPAINPKLCRYGSWGEGAVFPEGSGRK